MLKKLMCWWFGCDPDYEATYYDTGLDGWSEAVPCKRCGATDTTYGDRVGDTRHRRAVKLVRYWLFRRWWPEKCHECGKRFGTHSECDGIPF